MTTTSNPHPSAPGEIAPAQAFELAGQGDYVSGSFVKGSRWPLGKLKLQFGLLGVR